MPDIIEPSTKDGRAIPDRRPAIRLQNVRKEYQLYDSVADQALDVLGLSWLRFWRNINRRTFAALDGVDLEIGHGERVGIIGRNGAGKTTLLKLITGNFAPTAGTVEVDGEVQALMQTGLGFHGEFTGYKNIRASLMYNGLAGEELEAAIEDVIDFCELGDFLHQPVKTYSLGMRARLQFAAATAIKPDIVIVDEVLGAGDAYFSGKSAERVKRLTNQGGTLLIVSHSMSQILQFSDRAIWMDRGQIVSNGRPLDIVNQYEEFMHKLENRSNGASVSPTRDGTKSPTRDEANLQEIPLWIQRKGMSETMGADWGGNGPLRISSIGVLSAHNEETDSLDCERPFSLFADITTDTAGDFACSCLFVMYNETGEVVLRVVEPERQYSFDKSGVRHRVVARFTDNPIGKGTYLVSAGLYKDYNLLAPETGHRYHILSRGLKIRLSREHGDNSQIILTPHWAWDRIVESDANAACPTNHAQ